MTEYEFHPASEIFPMMNKREYSELLESIKDRGLMTPIVLLDGKVLDGRNRLKACKELGIEPDFVEYKNESSPWYYAWDQNAERRHLDAGLKAVIRLEIEVADGEWQRELKRLADKANKSRSEAAKTQHKSSNPRIGETISGGSDSVTTTKPKENKKRKARAKAAGVSPGTMAQAETLSVNAPDLYQQVLSGKKKLSAAYKELKKRNKSAKQAEAIKKIDEFPCLIECADFRDFLQRTEFDVVITDPPYPHEFIHLYEELAVICAEKKIKLVAAMAGQSYLPEILSNMSRHMSYRWIISYLTPGGQSVQLWDRNVNTFWKPVIILGEAREWFGDVAKSSTNDNDKAHHEWGQSESGMVDLITRLTKPGETICDPFCGGGTTAVAARLSGRGFVGCDIDESKVIETRKRLGHD